MALDIYVRPLACTRSDAWRGALSTARALFVTIITFWCTAALWRVSCAVLDAGTCASPWIHCPASLVPSVLGCRGCMDESSVIPYPRVGSRRIHMIHTFCRMRMVCISPVCMGGCPWAAEGRRRRLSSVRWGSRSLVSSQAIRSGWGCAPPWGSSWALRCGRGCVSSRPCRR